MKTYYICLFFILLPILSIKSQIGINTETPMHLLEVVSSTSSLAGKAFITTTSDNNESMQVRNDGYIGVGAINPLVKLDLRANNLAQENAIGIGYTALAAEDAEAGAIRYEPTSKVLQYSDGEVWLTLQDNPEKAIVIAQNFSEKLFPHSTQGVATGQLTNWTVIEDNTGGSFNAVDGNFIAPRDGLYSLSATAVFETENISSGAQFELVLRSATGQALKSVVAYFSVASQANVTNVNKVLFQLAAGDVCRAFIYMAGIRNPKLSADGTLTTLTIAEM